MYILISLIVSSVLPAAYYCGNVCPSGNAHNIHDVINAHGVVQEGIWHRLSCPEFRANEALLGLVWYKGSNLDSAKYLIGYFEGRTTIRNSRYEFSTDNFNLVIKGVKTTDEGSYLCSVIPSATIDREGKVDLVVIGDLFPASSGDEQETASLQRGRRNQLPCDCASHFPPAAISVVYWSTGEGVSTDTNIIGARFADGSVLQIQHGASYGIDSDFSLQMNSLGGVHDEQRFWCHVFKSNGTQSSCYTDVTISGDQPPDDKLAASSSSFYVLNGKPAILPCMSWEPGDPACNAQWFKVDDSNRHLLTYNLSTEELGIESGFDLADNFGLLVTMVNESSAGTYRCDLDRGRIVRETVDVLVIGANFPLDGGGVTIGETIKLEPNTRQMLRCPVKFSNILVKKTTIFWSFGTLDEQKSTTVIGNLVLPEGIKTMYDLGDNRCFNISNTTGSLLMTNCPQDKDVRYWCHVFIEGSVLHRSYADVTVDVPTHPVPVTIVIIVNIHVCIILLILVVVVSVCMWRRHKTSRRNTNRDGTYEAVEMEDSQAREHFPTSNRDLLTDKVLMDLSSSLSPTVFIQLGIKLGLKEAEIRMIQADNPGTFNQMFTMLVNWRNRQDRDDVISLLVKSLNDVGRKDLVDKIRDLVGHERIRLPAVKTSSAPSERRREQHDVSWFLQGYGTTGSRDKYS